MMGRRYRLTRRGQLLVDAGKLLAFSAVVAAVFLLFCAGALMFTAQIQ